MRYDSPPSNVSSLRARLINVAKGQNIVMGRLQQHVAVLVVVEFMQMLNRSDKPALLIKGGTSLELRFGIAASRTTRDLDVVTDQDIAIVYENLDQKLRAGWHGFTGAMTPPTPIDVPGLEVKPQRFNVKLQFNNKAFATVPLEVSPQEAGNTATFDVATSEALSLVGVETEIVVIPCMSIAWQIAQKLHACSDEASNDRRNDRAHDLVDLMLLEILVPDDQLANINNACIEVFQARARQSWPVKIKAHDHWQPLYVRATEGLEELDLPPSSAEAATRVDAFAQRIASATKLS